MQKSNIRLKIASIFMIIGGSLAILSGAVLILFGALFDIIDIHDLSDISTRFGRFVWLNLAIAASGGVIQLIAGIIGLKNSSKPEKQNICIILGLITIFFFIASQVISTIDAGDISHFDVIAMLLGLLIPSLYLISSIRHKKRIDLVEIIVERKEVIYEIIFTFIVCGVIGWAFETIEVWINHGTLTARGIFFISRINEFPLVWGLPFIMMYGIGGALLIWCFKPLKNEPVKLFFVGMLVLTIFEYITSVICEYAWDLILWDYTGVFMNFQGRICLTSSLAWGVLSVVSVKVLSPLFHKQYNKIKHKEILHAVLIILIVYITVCYSLRHVLFPDMV